ncbi:MAG TPA: hypothetical protein VLK78_01050 [Candidatus Angelobacter sp.]|nr:hypothetical protein [Candidatus Angelobacter sp.]
MSDTHSNSISEKGIHVHLIENTSGLFIGAVQANGWKSKSKTNQVFGHIHSSIVHGLIGLLQDNDHLDMINVDRSLTLNNKNGLEVDEEVKIQINGVYVNAMQYNANVSVGNSQVNQWDTKGKNNFGTGKLVGENDLKSIMNNIDDRDLFDMYSTGTEVSQTEQTQVD